MLYVPARSQKLFIRLLGRRDYILSNTERATFCPLLRNAFAYRFNELDN